MMRNWNEEPKYPNKDEETLINLDSIALHDVEENSIGLWHEIQNRLKNIWFDVVFHANSDDIFFLNFKINLSVRCQGLKFE
jgi:hypothetical protein